MLTVTDSKQRTSLSLSDAELSDIDKRIGKISPGQKLGPLSSTQSTFSEKKENENLFLLKSFARYNISQLLHH